MVWRCKQCNKWQHAQTGFWLIPDKMVCRICYVEALNLKGIKFDSQGRVEIVIKRKDNHK